MLRAVAEVIRRRPRTNLLMCGDGIETSNRQLRTLIDLVGIDESALHLLGVRPDVERLMAAVDVAVSSSVHEGWSNAIAEAMACGVPCVATTTGDATELIRGSGMVVPTRDPRALAEAILSLASRTSVPDAAARRRIVDHFDMASAAATYATVIRDTSVSG